MGNDIRKRPLRVIALLATYNEERFVGGCIEHLAGQGVDVHLLDNESTDQTVARAQAYLGCGLMDIEVLPRGGEFSLTKILERKQELAATLDADWFMHHDADEIRIGPRSGRRLVDALSDVDAAGFNAVNFREFTFVPTVEAPDHDHARFTQTMRHYYPFLPEFPHRLNAWKRQSEPVDLASSAGHKVAFAGLRMFPESFRMRHYLFLSRAHACEKYAGRTRSEAEMQQQWGGWRTTLAQRLTAGAGPALDLPRQDELRAYAGDDQLDAARPLTAHVWSATWARRLSAARDRTECNE